MKLVSTKNDGTDYLQLIQSIDARRVYLPQEANIGRQLMVRHDVDHDIEMALTMAQYEMEHGIKATYYLLPDATYFRKDSDTFMGQVKRFDNLGHFLGLHHQYLALAHMHGDEDIDVAELIHNDLDWFRQIGAFIVGASAHGSKRCTEHNFRNYELWEDCPDDLRSADFDHPTFTLRQFRLGYEAYFLQRDVYLTDTGHTWYGGVGSGIGQFEIPNENLGKDATIKAFNQMERGVMQLNIHPCWWEVIDD